MQELDHSSLDLIDGLTNPTGDSDSRLESLFGSTRDGLQQSSEVRVRIFKTSMSDGLNVSVSFDEESLCWIVGDESVSIGLQKADDVKLYHGDDLFEIKRAAECFFEGIEHLKPAELEALKEELRGFTIVGVYLGDYEIQ